MEFGVNIKVGGMGLDGGSEGKEKLVNGRWREGVEESVYVEVGGGYWVDG